LLKNKNLAKKDIYFAKKERKKIKIKSRSEKVLLKDKNLIIKKYKFCQEAKV
jgi:hypothetical protein